MRRNSKNPKAVCEWKEVEIHEAEICPYAGRYSAEGFGVVLYGITEWEKHYHDVRAIL